MSKKPIPTGKRARRELARRKAKRNKTIIITVCLVVFITATVLITYNVIQNSLADVYSNSEMTVKLRPDGRFRAALHDEKYRGSYATVDESGVIVITFTYGGKTAVTEIILDQLYLPDEWDDGHGHGDVLTKQ